MVPDYYKILEVAPDADAGALRKQHKRLVLKCAPAPPRDAREPRGKPEP